jgi:FkbM family methyltransferase
MYYSQQNEDKILHDKYLNYTNGFFIELGAMDGRMFSNTLFFENNLNWTGILIEPTLQYNELIINRPNCYNFNYAISEIDGEVEFIGHGALGCIVSDESISHINAWDLNKGTSYLVKSKPISKIIENINIPKVDFFSIDVEGHELKVLKTFNWEIPVYIILIEMSDYNDKTNEECRTLLLGKGFMFDSKIGNNEVWINHKFK